MALGLIAKAVLGGIGGGLQKGADTAKTNLSGGTPTADNNTQSTASDVGGLIGKGLKKITRNEEEAPEETEGESDLNLKEIYPDITDDLIRTFAEISPIKFTYKKEAQELYNGGKGVDSAEHIGVKAQELEANPVTSGTVTEDEHGFKQVDTRHLAFADTAMIAELCRKITELETRITALEANR